ncbi:PREDICTED: uncharacterized protein LOC106804693 [Priapulus caudatus]|uniref:Uncharacterized protein LOC106804693 n=1 Tax=Priapulus caudatus TaxID=37621 RepID=A0ABM1DNE1_PRICU|nr:PREDICTED: uncharacterized protein LOC106804693 [Priapulus caudatus]
MKRIYKRSKKYVKFGNSVMLVELRLDVRGVVGDNELPMKEGATGHARTSHATSREDDNGSTFPSAYLKEVLELLREKIYERVTQLVSHTETTGDKAKRNSARRYQCEVTIGDKVRVGYRFRKCSTANQWCVVKCCDIIASHPSAVEDDGGDVGV